MIDHIDIGKVLFLDIETVSGKSSFEELSPALQLLWTTKAKQVTRSVDEMSPEEISASYKDRAAIYAEFGKIICISVGFVQRDKEGNTLKLRLKSFAGDDEFAVLEEFAQLLNHYYKNLTDIYLCGHNIREFDIPYICRRMVVNGMKLPLAVNLAGKKPWEVKHLLDTMELWKFGDNKAYTSLNLLSAILDFPTPKDDMDGSQVGRVYWEEKDLDRISFYCEKDVLATVQLFLRYQRMDILRDEQISHVRDDGRAA